MKKVQDAGFTSVFCGFGCSADSIYVITADKSKRKKDQSREAFEDIEKNGTRQGRRQVTDIA